MKEQIKQLRVEIDGLAQLCEGLKPIKDGAAIHNRLKGLELFNVYSTASERAIHKAKYEKEYDQVIRETSKNTNEILEAIKSLKLSKAWLGKALGELGEETPYKNDGLRKEVKDIEPVADKDLLTGKSLEKSWLVDDNMELWSKKSHIEKVDWLREEIKAVIQRLSNTFNYNEFGVSNGELAMVYLQEARFWLGFELGRIRDESN